MNTNINIFDQFQTRRYKKGQLVLFQGEIPRFGFALKEGIIKEYDISKQGNEQITWLINKSEIFPFSWLMGSVPTVPFYYETVSDCELYIIKKEEYLMLLENNKSFLRDELNRQAMKENAQARRIAAILNPKAENKLLNTFHYLVESYGSSSGKNNIIINLFLTHQDFANLTGLTRETVTKELSKLKSASIIKQNNKRSKYEIDLNKLNQLISTPLSNPYL